MTVEYTEITSCDAPAQVDFTIVTICRNVLPELQQTLESVLFHKAKEAALSIEHVVVDGASTDGTPEWLAEQMAAGRIEQYVSEPDAGIYDAMNKGINMARGAVIAFLNAGDSYLPEADLSHIVRLITEGRTQSVAAKVSTGRGELVPCYDTLLFVDCPCCHQGYFASTALCRRLGGFDARRYRRSGDADLMYRVYRETGLPEIVDEPVALFSPGGFSSMYALRYWDEMLEMYRRNWDLCFERAKQDTDFQRLHIAELSQRCRKLMDWQAAYHCIPEQVAALRTIVQELASLPGFPMHSLLLRLVAAFPLRQLEKCPRCGILGCTLIWLTYFSCALPASHPMFRHRYYVRPTFGAYIEKLLHRLLPPRRKAAC